MTENGNQKRPVRTLEVENFSVIKKARLEFGRITVIIGPQASGKSLLCKLAYVFRWRSYRGRS
jgi:predicted ATPase